METNPTGLQLGFWANYTRGDRVLREFGHRPIERVGFEKWNMLETAEGRYDFGRNPNHPFEQNVRAHLNGSTMVANINISFTRSVNPDGFDAIPSFYPQQITNPKTREAARRFLRAYVKEMLGRFGTVVLAIDYEFPWFADFRVPSNRLEYRDWIVEASAVAREAAAEIQAGERLKLMSIVNVDPYNGRPFFGGTDAKSPGHQAWLQDIFDAADYLGMDIYEYTLADHTDPETAFRTMKFWIDTYGRGKPAFVTEVGMSTILEKNPTFDGLWKTHNYGTNQEQAEFFDNLLSRIHAFNQSPDGLNNQLRGVCLWMYSDMPVVNGDMFSVNPYFGLVREDLTPKPAWEVVRRSIRKLESDPGSAPSRIKAQKALGRDFPGAGVNVEFQSGTAYDAVEWQLDAKSLPQGPAVLVVETEQPGSVILSVDGNHWMGGQSLPPATRQELDLTGLLQPGEDHTIRLLFTNEKLPFSQKVISIHWKQG